MQTVIKKQARFDTRLSLEQKQSFEKAAYLGGFRNLTEFIISSAQAKANQIIKENEQIIESEKDAKIFFEAITNSKNPSKTLVKALKDYNSFIAKNSK